jgi:hypothetical protein
VSCESRLLSVWALPVALVLLLALLPGAARADDEGASWRFAPAEAPPPPAGAQPSPFPAALGDVGDISFWAPNRGLLITAGNTFVPAGLYAYDGVSWHQLSTECGATNGRIAWAGPDEFWTISDQRPGQITANGTNSFLYEDVSLCHFLNGQIVGSYALPVEQPNSYRPMDAAACHVPEVPDEPAEPAECWFGGQLGETQDSGAFHLHWNGSTLSVVYSPQDHAISSMAVDQGEIYESVQLAPGDSYGKESVTSPPLLHTIVTSDPSEVFHPKFPIEAGCIGFCSTLPDYGTNASNQAVAPDTLAGLSLSSDWSPSGEGPASPQLWALAGPDTTNPPLGQGVAHPVALRYSKEEWAQIVPNLATFESGEDPIGVAADPGEQAAWVTISSDDGIAHADLLSSVGAGGKWSVSERVALGPEQGVGPRGEAGPIACPSAHECWLATKEGWLFHLTDGAQLANDGDPFFDGQDGVITYRPPDNGVPEVLPDEEAEGGSAGQQPVPPVVTPATSTTHGVKGTAKKALVSHVRTRLLKRDVLELTFTLSGKARVQLLASRHGSVVARSRRETLRKGAHTVKVALNPRRWPTKLDLHATAA